MQPLKICSASEQVADYLRTQIQRRRWSETLPGENGLITDLQIGRDTIRAALAQLEAEGWLISQGAGRKRRIVLLSEIPRAHFQVTLLFHSPGSHREEEVCDLLLHLGEKGYDVSIAPKTLTELGMDPKRVARMAKDVKTDAWVVMAASRSVLSWFATQPTPAFGLFGGFPPEPMACIGPDKSGAYVSIVRRLVALGHRRIVLLMPEHARKPKPDRVIQGVLDEMNALGLETGPYNLPDWSADPAGVRKILDTLFELTPPTAILLDQPHEFLAAQQHLAERGILAPRHISLACCEDDPSFVWFERPVSRIRSDIRPRINRIGRWVDNVAGGKNDRRRSFTEAVFIEGETIGPVPAPR